MLKVSGIFESGSNNLLKWAIKNGVNPKENFHLSTLVNTELHYNVIINNLNFYELFRLTQAHRTKLKVIKVYQVNDLISKEYDLRFDPNDHNTIRNLLNKFFSISSQLAEDSDVNDKLYSRLILPMISTKYDVQIPIGFGDILNALTIDESAELFSNQYPDNLENFLSKESVIHKILMFIDKDTRNIQYHEQMEKLIDATKYSGISDNINEIFKVKLLSFEKEDNITRKTINNTVFKSDKESIIQNLKTMSRLRNETIYTFTVQLPIYLMQILESSYPDDIVDISFRSSVENILGNDSYIDENIINTYGLRITETCHELFTTMIKLLTNSDEKESVIALLPASQFTNAVIKIKFNDLKQLMNHPDPTISSMFAKIEQIARSIEIDIQKMKE